MFLLVHTLNAAAQNYDDPVVYMKAINNTQTDFNKTYLSFISAAWHSNRAGKIDRLRQQMVTNLTTCRYKLIDLPYYKHDNSLRQANIDYLWLLTKIFNDDYSHLVNMEDLVEQSYDKMELYLLFEEKINDTLKMANERMAQAEKDFAAKYNVALTSNKNEVVQKMETSNKVSKYRNRVYLLFFKCAWQEGQVMDAVSKKNITKTEQARSALLKYAEDGFAALDSLGGYDNDATMIATCRQALTFFKKEGETELPKLSDFLLKQENFSKIEASYNAKPKNSHTKEDDDGYKAALAETNKAYETATQGLKNIITERNKVIDNWNKVEQKFIDTHMPYY